MSDFTRLSVNINDETAKAIRELMARHDTSATEVIRTAVGVLKFVDDETTVKGLRLALIDSSGHYDRVLGVTYAPWEDNPS